MTDACRTRKHIGRTPEMCCYSIALILTLGCRLPLITIVKNNSFFKG